MIGDNIVVTVVSIKGQRVRLGIEADKSIEVNREEVHREKQISKAVNPNKSSDS